MYKSLKFPLYIFLYALFFDVVASQVPLPQINQQEVKKAEEEQPDIKQQQEKNANENKLLRQYFKGLYPANHWALQPYLIKNANVLGLGYYGDSEYALYLNPTDKRGYRGLVRFIKSLSGN